MRWWTARIREWRHDRAWREALRRQAREAAAAWDLRWWREPLLWLRERRRRFLWIRAGARLERLRRRAIATVDERLRVAAIDEANATVARLELAGAVTRAEGLEMRRDWVQAVAREQLVDFFRARDALGVARMTPFLRRRAG
jgi:hypothetical protein